MRSSTRPSSSSCDSFAQRRLTASHTFGKLLPAHLQLMVCGLASPCCPLHTLPAVRALRALKRWQGLRLSCRWDRIDQGSSREACRARQSPVTYTGRVARRVGSCDSRLGTTVRRFSGEGDPSLDAGLAVRCRWLGEFKGTAGHATYWPSLSALPRHRARAAALAS